MENTFCVPKFSPYLPENEQEKIQMINLSTNGKATMSQKSAIKKNPLVDNPDEEEKNLEQEQQEEQEKQTQFMGTGDTALLNE